MIKPTEVAGGRLPEILGEWVDPGYGRERAWLAADVIAIHLVDDQSHVAWRRRPQFDGWAEETWVTIMDGSSSLSADEVLRCDAFGNWDGQELDAPAEVDLLIVEGRALAAELLTSAVAERLYRSVATSLN